VDVPRNKRVQARQHDGERAKNLAGANLWEHPRGGRYSSSEITELRFHAKLATTSFAKMDRDFHHRGRVNCQHGCGTVRILEFSLRDAFDERTTVRFRKAGYEAIDRICDYYYQLQTNSQVQAAVEPGYLRALLPGTL
jgi:hypothetical protein